MNSYWLKSILIILNCFKSNLSNIVIEMYYNMWKIMHFAIKLFLLDHMWEQINKIKQILGIIYTLGWDIILTIHKHMICWKYSRAPIIRTPSIRIVHLSGSIKCDTMLFSVIFQTFSCKNRSFSAHSLKEVQKMLLSYLKNLKI